MCFFRALLECFHTKMQPPFLEITIAAPSYTRSTRKNPGYSPVCPFPLPLPSCLCDRSFISLVFHFCCSTIVRARISLSEGPPRRLGREGGRPVQIRILRHSIVHSICIGQRLRGDPFRALRTGTEPKTKGCTPLPNLPSIFPPGLEPRVGSGDRP